MKNESFSFFSELKNRFGKFNDKKSKKPIESKTAKENPNHKLNVYEKTTIGSCCTLGCNIALG